MLFNSYIFLFGFLPVALLGYQIAAHFHRRAVVLWLAFISLAFYAYWNPVYVLLLCASVLFNYVAGALIRPPHFEQRRHAHPPHRGDRHQPRRACATSSTSSRS